MRTKGFTWYWPLSFLAALGQLLLLLTHNASGPGWGRLVLAFWVLCIPGSWLGHLLTKPELRLPEALSVRFSLAVAVHGLVLLLRKPLSPDAPPLILSFLAVAVSLAYTFRPLRRLESPRFAPVSGRFLRQAVGWIAVLVAAFQVWTVERVPLSPESLDHASAAEAVGPTHHWFAPPTQDLRAGQPGFDPERGLLDAWLDLVARTSGQSPETVLRWLPVLVAPLVFLTLCLVGWTVLERRGLGLCAGLLGLLLLGTAGGEGAWTWAAHPGWVGWVALWSALALLLRGQDEPRPLHLVAWILCAFAAMAMHWGWVLLLALAWLVLSLRAVTSVVRLQENLPALAAYGVPAALAAALVAGLRYGETGSVNLFALPAQKLLVVGPDLRLLDPALLSFPEQLGFLLALGLLPLLWNRGRQDPKIFFLLLAPYAVQLTAYNPWVLSPLEKGWGSNVHLLAALCPVPVSVVALGHWGWDGLHRSLGWTWLRLAAVAGTVVLAGSAIYLCAADLAAGPRETRYSEPAPALESTAARRDRAEHPERALAVPQSVAAQDLTHAPGDTVTLWVDWTEAFGAGNRARAELHLSRSEADGAGAGLRENLMDWWDWIRGRKTSAVVERSLPADTTRTTMRLPLSTELPPGSYDVRVAAMPGRHPVQRIRDGYLFLKQTQTTLAVTEP